MGNKRDQTMETEDQGMIDQEIQEAEARGMEEDVDRSVVEEDEGLKLMASESIDEENQGLGESGSKECSGEKSVENMVEVVDHGIEEKQETKRMKDFEEGMIVEAGESESKKRKVMTVEKKLVKKQAKKVKGEKRRVRRRRAKQLRNNFLSIQPSLGALQNGCVTEEQTGVVIKELKSEVLVIGQTTKEIDRKLQISLLNQAKLKEEIAAFRKSFEDKMVEELDEQKTKISVLQQLIRNKEEVVLEKMKEKSEIEAALDKLASIERVETGKVIALEAASQKLEEEVKEHKGKEEKLLSKLALIEKEKEMEIEGKHNMEAEVVKMKGLLQKKEEELQELIKKDSAMPSTSGNFQAGLRKKILKTLNSGSAADIAELPTIGNVTALKVIALRQKKGSFADVADLKALGYGFYVKFVKANHLDLKM